VGLRQMLPRQTMRILLNIARGYSLLDSGGLRALLAICCSLFEEQIANSEQPIANSRF